MFTTLPTRLKRASRWLPALLLPLAAQAQFNYTPANAVNSTTVYTDLAATGAAIATANTDDANSAATDIGFPFNFNGVAFTQFVLNTNGYLKLGATAPVAPFFGAGPQTPTGGPMDSADPNLILPFNFDLEDGNGAGGAEYRVATTGTAPARVATIQWKNVSPKTLQLTVGSAIIVDKQCLSMDFQVKLYEGSNAIEFVYGPAVANANVQRAAHWAVAGLKGSSAARGQNVVVEKSVTSPSFSTAAFITGPYTNIYAFNIRRTDLPDAGRTFRFSGPSLANDAAVRALYTLGKVSGTYASPATAQVVVDNLGSAAQTNLVVRFAVTGANPYTSTQTVAALPSGGSTTLTFAYPVAGTTGANVLTASVPGTDDLATNNTKTASQDVTAASLSYIESSRPLAALGLTTGEPDGVLAVRYTLVQAAAVTSVAATFVGIGIPGVTYEVQLYDAAGAGGTPGAIVYASPPQLRPSVPGTVVIAIPNVSLNPGDFFVAIKELDEAVGLGFQVEDPLRPAAFYYQIPDRQLPSSPFVSADAYARGGRFALEVGLGAPVVTATRNAALAATVALYPNPASRAFTLEVPAGSLRTASATLRNALGQVVLTRVLSASGTTAFDVSGLPAGMYSLALKAGNDLVVKRVVVE